MATITKLREARERIATIGWTQGTYARDSAGKPVDPDSPDAVCFCIYGAFRLRNVHRVYPDAIGFLKLAIGEDYISIWQDDPWRNKEEILAAFDGAITLAEAA